VKVSTNVSLKAMVVASLTMIMAIEMTITIPASTLTPEPQGDFFTLGWYAFS